MKKWYDEEYAFEIEVTGFLRGDHTERYCRNGEGGRGQVHLHLWLPCKRAGAGNLFQNHDDAVPNHGGGQERRRFGEYRR